MKERLKELRRALNMNQQDFADALNVGRSTIANYEAGTREPIEAVISLICKTWNVSPNWLRNGDGEVFVQVSQHDEIQRMVDEMLLDDSADVKRRLVAAILQMSPDQIRLAIDWIKDTFNLVEAEDRTIDEEVASYRAELEEEAAFEKLSQSDTGSAKRA